MPFIIPDSAEADFLELITSVGYTLRLYQGDMISGQTADAVDAYTSASFTEASFAGYAPVSLTPASWSITEGAPSEAEYPAQTFTRSTTGAAESIYGHYLTRNSDGALRWFEQYDGPVVIEFAADALVVAAKLTLEDIDGGSSVEPGTITAYGGDTAPNGTLLCDGSAVSRTTFAALFAAIGTTYGSGNGSTTFNVPDLRQRFALGKAANGTGSTLGNSGGEIDHEHELDHDRAFAEIYAATAPNNWIYMRRVTNATNPYDLNYRSGGTSDGAVGSGATAGVGLQGDTDGNNPPYLVVNHIIYT